MNNCVMSVLFAMNKDDCEIAKIRQHTCQTNSKCQSAVTITSEILLLSMNY